MTSRLPFSLFALLCVFCGHSVSATPRNILFILANDHPAAHPTAHGFGAAFPAARMEFATIR